MRLVCLATRRAVHVLACSLSALPDVAKGLLPCARLRASLSTAMSLPGLTAAPAVLTLQVGPPSEEEASAPPDSGATIGAPATAAPTLAYGLKCLRNALLLCGVQLGGSGLASATVLLQVIQPQTED